MADQHEDHNGGSPMKANKPGEEETLSTEKSAHLSWEEIKEICNEVALLYSTTERDDIDKLENIKKLQDEMMLIMERYQEDAKTSIRELTRKVEEEEEQNVRICPDSDYQKQLEEIKAQKEKLERAIADMQSNEQAAVGELAAMKVKAEELEKLSNELQTRKTVDGPRVRYAISLYANITGIKWKYDTEPNRVAGYIAHAEADGVRSFDLDTSAYSEIALADKLWEVIDARPSARVA